MNQKLMFSSGKDEWATPQDLYDRLHAEFDFTLDVAASITNRKCLDYFGLDNGKDALTQAWSPLGARARCFMNPPYSRRLQKQFIAKAADERKKGVLTVALLPVRTDTKAFHTFIYDVQQWHPRPGIEIRLLHGRLKFGGAKNGAPYPSMIVVFRPCRGVDQKGPHA